MKRIVLAFVLFVASLVASAQVGDGSGITYTVNADGSATITLSAATVVACIEQGGCAVVSRKWLEDMLRISKGAAL